jgi:hypothetical protein
LANTARDRLFREVTLRGSDASHLAVAAAVIASERKTRDSGGESSQDWNEGEETHGVWF